MERTSLTKTLVVWQRVGKEHGEDDLRLNPPDVVQRYINKKVEVFRQTPPDAWRWWLVDENLIVEQADVDPQPGNPGTHIFYLLNRGLTVVENIYLPHPNDNWKWYIHLSDFEHKSGKGYWVMKDLFCHISVEKDTRTYHIFDLPDLAQALDIGLITPAQSKDLLKRVDWAANRIARGEFPFPEIIKGQEACSLLSWR